MRPKRRLFINEEHQEPLINLTPLIDVVFVLLVTFMLIAPILNVERIELAPSGITSKKETKHTSLVILLKADQSIWFQDQILDLQKFTEVMKVQKSIFPGHTPQLIADKNCHFGLYQEVKNRLEECGFEQLDVILR